MRYPEGNGYGDGFGRYPYHLATRSRATKDHKGPQRTINDHKGNKQQATSQALNPD